ncbi:galactokinase family protein [Deinococcus multiflagellatus]|uniref:Galactokinase family protein n=1 Tax=Deinococcus multiflagellatus TaxID=1656887 RepID=A0ABW1ZF23_9DEIO
MNLLGEHTDYQGASCCPRPFRRSPR